MGDVCDDDKDGDNYTVAQGDLNDYDASIYPGSVASNGDINGNGQINAGDLVLMQRHVLGASVITDPDSITRGDLYPPGAGDGQLTVQDMLLLQKILLVN